MATYPSQYDNPCICEVCACNGGKGCEEVAP